MDALDRAREDLANDRAWKAKDRLQGVIGQRYDRAVVGLLADAHLAMKDYPAAGGLCFVLGRDDDIARAAIAAWHAKNPSAEARLLSLPKRIRVDAAGAHVDELRDAAARWASGERPPPPVPVPRTRGDRMFEFGCITLLVIFALAVLIGLADFISILWRA